MTRKVKIRSLMTLTGHLQRNKVYEGHISDKSVYLITDGDVEVNISNDLLRSNTSFQFITSVNENTRLI